MRRQIVTVLIALVVLTAWSARAQDAGTASGAELKKAAPATVVQAAAEVKPDFGPLQDTAAKSHDDLVKKGWVYLFDSRVDKPWNPLSLWRVRNPNQPDRNHWTVVDEQGERILKNEITSGVHGTDLISLQQFWDFDIHAEVRVAANSGLYLRGRYEIQINSTPAEAEKKIGRGDLGGIYSVSDPLVNASKGPGVWQTIDAMIRGYTISVWLNGTLIQDKVEIPEKWLGGTGSQLGSGDGVSGEPTSPGPIFLQGDHGSVEFRNIRVRPDAGVPRVREQGVRILRPQILRRLKQAAELKKEE